MIDSHCHLLPGLDDGVSSWDEALALAGIAYQNGTIALVVTPHYLPGSFTPEPNLIRDQVEEFRARLAAAGIELMIHPGCEAYLTPELPQLVRKGGVLTWGDTGRYILVELPMLDLPPWTDKVLFEIHLGGLTPILAHPERCAGIQRRLDWLSEAVNRGTLVQVNGPSLTGQYGRIVQKIARNLLKNGLVHLLGSDAHSRHRPADLSAPAREIQRRLDPERAAAILSGNPLNLLQGASLPEVAAAGESSRRRWWWPWR